jgi:outer membrane protein assembly factor BamB
LCAYDAKNGKFAWDYTSGNTGAQPTGAPHYADGHVYFNYISQGCCGGFVGIVALNASSGTVAWSTGIGPTDPWSDLAVGDGMVYEACVNSVGVNICAYNDSSGALVWSDLISSGSGYGAYSPSVNGKGNILYVAANDENTGDFDLLAFNASTGASLWANHITNPNGSNAGIATPTIDAKDNSYWTIGCDGCAATGIYGYDKSGKQLWFDQDLNTQGCQPTVANGVVYTCAGGNGGPAYGLNAATGATLWSSSSDGPSFGASPIVLKGTVYQPNWTLNAYGLSSQLERKSR